MYSSAVLKKGFAKNKCCKLCLLINIKTKLARLSTFALRKPMRGLFGQVIIILEKRYAGHLSIASDDKRITNEQVQ